MEMKKTQFKFIPLHSGGALHLLNHSVPVVIDLDTFEPDDPPWDACIEHDPERVAGKINRLEIGKNEDGTSCLNAYGEFENNEHAWQIKVRERSGARVEGSIHIVRPKESDVEIVPAGKSVSVNGRTFVGPLKVIRRWRLEEGSFVGFGGDPKNEVEIAAKGKVLPIVENEEKMDPEFLDYLKNICGLEDVENIAPENLNVLERCFNAWLEAKSAAETNVEAECKDVEAEGEEPEKKDEDKAETEEPEKKEDVEAEGEEPETEPEKKQTPVAASGRNPAFDLSSRKRNASTGHSGRPDVNKVIAIAMLEGMGMDSKEIAASGGYSPNAMNEGLSNRYRNLTLKGMFCEAFERRLGGKWTGREAGFAGKALQIMHNDSSVMASGGFSTISPLTIIQDILQLQYRAGFENFEGVAEKLSDINYNDDLMEAKMANYDIEGGLEEVGEDGEIQHGTLTSEEIVTQVYTYANLLTLTEKMIINDRLDALSKLSLKQGRKAKIQRERAWFKEFMANAETLCTSGRGNKLTATLSIAGLSSAVDALASMETIGSTATDPEFTELEGKFLLVPHALLPTAQTLYHDTKCDLVGLGERLESNPHVNEYEPVSSTYFGSKMATFGGSNTHWALFGDPAICPAMVISHLRGEEKPRIERLPVQPNILGYSFRTVYRYGVNIGDYRGVVYSDGTV